MWNSMERTLKNAPFLEVCKWKMWTEMENANIEKLCRYFSNKKVHQELTCFSSQSTIFIPPLTTIFIFIIIDLHTFFPCYRVYHIPLLTTFTFSHQWTSWSHQLSYNQTLFYHSPLLWGWFHMITLFMFFSFLLLWMAIHICLYCSKIQ